MKSRRSRSLLTALRAELAYFAVLCVMVLAIPLVLPVAKAQTFLSGLVICTQAGIKADTRHNAPRPTHADCACVLAGHGCVAGKVAKALQVGWVLADSTPETAVPWLPDRTLERFQQAHSHAANSIRGPPSQV